MMSEPLISIGMPVFNAEKTLASAIESIIHQCFSDFELIISDNASTDGTAEICRNYAASDSRIRYVRQRENIGAANNFRFVLMEARAKYFMWASSDDTRSLDYLKVNYDFLINNTDYVASTSPVRFEGSDFNSKAMGDFSLSGTLSERMYMFFEGWHANGRYYSLMSADILKRSKYMHEDFFGSDWAVMLEVVRAGKTNRTDQGYVVLGRDGFSNSGKIFRHYRSKAIHFIAPFFELIKATITLTDELSTKYRILILIKLIKLNYNAFRTMLLIEYKRIKSMKKQK